MHYFLYLTEHTLLIIDIHTLIIDHISIVFQFVTIPYVLGDEI